MRTFLISIFVLVVGLSFSCGSSTLREKECNIDTVGVYHNCRLFVKAISTKDTILFYKVVNSDKLVTYLENKHPQDLINRQDLFFPFFFVFSPFKVRMDSFIHKRSEDLFRLFKIETVDYLDECKVRIGISWITTLFTDRQSISLTLMKEDHEWKIVGADWEELAE